MTLVSVSIVLALMAGSARAVLLWRAYSRVDVVNVAIVTTLGEGRAKDLPRLLSSTGPAIYPRMARLVCEPTDKLMHGSPNEVRARLEHDATAALVTANRELKRHGWLDAVTLAAIAFSGISVLLGEAPSMASAAGLGAASLLWIANQRAARHIATNLYAGAMALVDSLINALEQIRQIVENAGSRTLQ